MHRRILHIFYKTDLLKPDVSKLNYPLYPPWDWAENPSDVQPLCKPLLTGVPAGRSVINCFSPLADVSAGKSGRCYEISKTLKTVSRPIIIRGRTQ